LRRVHGSVAAADDGDPAPGALTDPKLPGAGSRPGDAVEALSRRAERQAAVGADGQKDGGEAEAGAVAQQVGECEVASERDAGAELEFPARFRK
jgi:hypothetical protein